MNAAPSERTRVSFVIPTHDEEDVLGATLADLFAAARDLGEPFEVLVVADGCTDGTAAIARESGARVLEVTHRQIAATRNAGAAATDGDRLVFVDADTSIGPELLRATWAALENGAIGGGARCAFDEHMPKWRGRVVTAFATALWYAGVAPGCYFFCLRSEFDAVGGFDAELFAGEEVRLSAALRKRGRFRLLRERAVTSSRKIRTHTTGEIFAAALRPLWRGRKAFREREGLDVWYGKRRPDPLDSGS